MDSVAQPPALVLVTGATGFLGQFVCHELKELGCEVLRISRNLGFNLLYEDQALKAILTTKPQVVIHLAAPTFPAEEQGATFRDTLKLGMNVLDAALLAGAKFVTVAPRSIYGPPAVFGGSKFKAIPETCLHVGPATDAQGDAKRALAMACSRYYAQYKMPYAFLVLASPYGPMEMPNAGIGFMIKSILDMSTEPEFAFSGVSGEEQIEPLFIQDAAKAIVKAALSLEHDGIVNIGSGEALECQAIGKLVAEVIEYKGKIHFNEKPATPSLPLAPEIAEKLMGWKVSTPIAEGIRVTVDWYAASREAQEAKA